MKYSIDLIYKTPVEWAVNALKDMDSFLIDHADNERKASAMCMSFIAKAPDKVEIHKELIETAIEELEHFRDVYNVMLERKIHFPDKIHEDKYIALLINNCRSGREERMMDRLLIASIIEMRGMERFKLISEVINDDKLKKFYKELYISEAKHGTIFVKMCLNYWSESDVYIRLHELNEIESKICEKLEWRSAVH